MSETEDRQWEQLYQWYREFHRRFAPHFIRAEARQRSGRYVQALLQPVERKTGWQLAEAMGERTPDGTQRLLYQARWDEEAVGDELECFVAEQFGDPEEGIIVLDESGFPKKGPKSVGVKRQYCGAVGKIENCQVGVFLSYVSPKGHTFLDRRLYLPAPEWIEDAARRHEAGVPEEIGFQTKAELAQAMLEHAWELGVPSRWVTGDEIYGSDRKLRIWLELEHRSYVLGVRGNEKPWSLTPRGPAQVAVSELAAGVPAKGWKRLSAGAGSKGPRWYDWAWMPLIAPIAPEWGRWLLVRRGLADPIELAYYIVYAPRQTTVAQAVHVAGSRWTVE